DAWPYAPLVHATSSPAWARCRASTFAIVGHSIGETATATRKEERRFLPMPKGRGLRAANWMIQQSGGERYDEPREHGEELAAETSAPITVVLADDHALVREGTRRLLEAEPDIRVVGEAGDGLAAIEQAERTRPDVVIMDIAMPGM